ncbi:hypothetical protein [Nonomuraea guangzhouensis]|uniref:Sensor domain-containing protein n=1 Tax=Nonomuraea guangzhouensis TaxID=1291555 RepID=A0ABW4G7Y1_9ACTN|nr:hypothetical protein [Nonomuraea guangzhouensis]
MAGVIAKWSFPLAGVLAGSLLTSSPGLAQNVSAQRSADPLKAALLVPKDLGSDFSRRDYRTTGLRNSTFAHSTACGKASKRLTAVYRTKIATALKHQERWEGISEYIVSGTSSEISTLERAAKAMVRHCRKITVKTDGSRDIIRQLSIGRLGDSTYGIKFRSGFPNSNLERDSELASSMMVAIDVVIIRVKNTLMVLEHDGNVGEFDSALTKSAAKTAVARLLETRE